MSDPDDGLVYAIKATVGQLNALKSSDYDGGKLLLSTVNFRPNSRRAFPDAELSLKGGKLANYSHGTSTTI